MTRRLYDLAAADPALRFSPYCWRTRLALAHKGLDVETVPWRFTDREAIAFSGQKLVPVLVDGEATISDSFAIAVHLEETYADRPSLFGGPGGIAAARFLNTWTAIVQMALARLIAADIFACIDEKDKAYFRESREKRFGATLESLAAGRESSVLGFRGQLQPLRTTLGDRPFLGGETPLYIDYIAFGAFQWARCTSRFALLAPDDPLQPWILRMLGLFDGLAGRAVTV